MWQIFVGSMCSFIFGWRYVCVCVSVCALLFFHFSFLPFGIHLCYSLVSLVLFSSHSTYFSKYSLLYCSIDRTRANAARLVSYFTSKWTVRTVELFISWGVYNPNKQTTSTRKHYNLTFDTQNINYSLHDMCWLAGWCW